MNKTSRRKTAMVAAKLAGAPGKSAPDDMEPSLPPPAKDPLPPPLCAARGDDDLMSQLQSEPRRG